MKLHPQSCETAKVLMVGPFPMHLLCEKKAKKNHGGQTLSELNGRGGLTVVEIFACLKHFPTGTFWADMPPHAKAHLLAYLMRLDRKYLLEFGNKDEVKVFEDAHKVFEHKADETEIIPHSIWLELEKLWHGKTEIERENGWDAFCGRMTDKKINELQKICDGIEYSRHIPQEAEQIAKDNNFIVIVGGSDDLMYAYGARCYLTDTCEHSYGWEGDTLERIDDEHLQHEANQLGLKIWWCGEIKKEGLKIKGYDTKENGAFSYTVNDNINSATFKVVEGKDVYCTGIIIELPSNFANQILT